ncbi:MAG TPA: ferritin-like domain-containing protein [Chthoniobacterales bacterium]
MEETVMHHPIEPAQNPNLSQFPASLPPPHRLARRSFLRSLGMGAALLAPGASILADAMDSKKTGDDKKKPKHGKLKEGDAAILRFLTAAELIEDDMWQQYTELATGNPAYQDAIEQLDEDMPQYIADNTDDELSHHTFLNAFLHANGADGVNLDAFRTLPSSSATGAANIGRLTNLSHVNVDTSWYLRYRSTQNPDLGATFPQFINISNFPTIPGNDLPAGDQLQAIANAAGFHFAAIEQGGTSLYATMALQASSLTVLQIIAGIGGAEVVHFAVWHDKAGNAPAVSVPGVTFPDMGSFDGDESRQNNLIMPEPCAFIDSTLPACSVIRPGTPANSGAGAALRALTNSNIFSGQSGQFLSLLQSLAHDADGARREGGGH